MKRLAVLVLLLSTDSAAFAQIEAPGVELPSDAARVRAVASRIDAPPVLDGEVLADQAWSVVEPIKGFWQSTPFEGRPASEETEVRIAYTSKTLYFGVVCYDANPSAIIVSGNRRDSALDSTDSFLIILDTFMDRRNGFVFGTNPAGIEYDAQVANEGEGTGVFDAGGGSGGLNLEWDGSWEVRARVFDGGWSAEFAIPLRTLRYPSMDVQTWGLNFQRNIPRRQEIAYWAALPKQFNLYRVSRAGILEGLEVSQQRNLKVTPYVLGRVRDRGGLEPANRAWLGDSGFDLKYSLTPGLTLDATYNTDFAQVEVDRQQINLDRFNLFFPEKRPFFLENASLFSVGTAGELELFFSRRIGIADDGGPIPILGGARVTGKVGGMSVGLLTMQTEARGDTSSSNFSVARVRREMHNRSSLGAIVVNRQGSGAGSDYNRTFGFDGRLGVGRYGEISGFVARTATPGLSDNQYAYKIGSSYESPAWMYRLNFTEVRENFRPEVGFLARENYRRLDAGLFQFYRPRNFLALQEIRPHTTYLAYWNLNGFLESARFHLDSHWDWRNGYGMNTVFDFTWEQVVEPFEIFPGVIVPPGGYEHREGTLLLRTNAAAPLSFSVRTIAGGFFGGERLMLAPSVRLRLGESFDSSITLSRNDIELPGSAFVTNLVQSSLSYSFGPRIFVQSLVQYNDRADLWSTNLRFGWLQAANTGVFLVYNDTRGLAGSGFGRPDRSLTLKISRMLDVLN